MQLCSKPRGARGIEPETFRRRGQLLSRPPTSGPLDVHRLIKYQYVCLYVCMYLRVTGSLIGSVSAPALLAALALSLHVSKTAWVGVLRPMPTQVDAGLGLA